MAIVPVALPPSNASSIAMGPCLTVRFRRMSVPFSTVAVSIASPVGVFTVSETIHEPPSSLSSVWLVSDIDWAPTSIFAL